MTRFAASPALLSTCDPEPRVWLRRLLDWERIVRRYRLRLAASDTTLEALGRDGYGLDYPTLAARAVACGVSDLASFHRVLRTLRDSCDFMTDDVDVEAVTASGCLSAIPAVAARDATAFVLARYPYLAGGYISEKEQVAFKEVVLDDDGNVFEIPRDFEVVCLASDEDARTAADLAQFGSMPNAGLAIATENLRRAGATISCTGYPLATLSETLEGQDPEVVRATFRSMAALLMPPTVRPGGLNEHPVRVSKSPSAANRRSELGDAYRAKVAAGGVHRLHYWRDRDTVAFATLDDHDVFDVAIAQPGTDRWPDV